LSGVRQSKIVRNRAQLDILQLNRLTRHIGSYINPVKRKTLPELNYLKQACKINYFLLIPSKCADKFRSSLIFFSKPAPPVEKKDDNLEDSEVLKMLRSSNISEEGTGLRRTDHGRRISRGSDNNDEGNLDCR
jgi:hypothetical protein